MVCINWNSTRWLLITLIHLSFSKSHVPLPLLWVYIVSLPLTRLACIAVGVVLMWKRHSKLSPTMAAKIYLMLGLALSLMEDFPNFVTACDGNGE
jgi:hypothetical protein